MGYKTPCSQLNLHVFIELTYVFQLLYNDHGLL